MIASLALSYLAVSIGVGIAALLFFAVHKKLKSRYSVGSLSFIWIAMACCLLLPVGRLLSVNGVQNKVPIEITIPSAEPVASGGNPVASIGQENNNTAAAAIKAETETQPVTHEETAAPSPAVLIDWPSFLGFVWILGVAVSGLYHGFCYILFRNSIRQYATECPEPIREMADTVRRELSIRRSIRIRQYVQCKSPFLIGILRPMILIPANPAESLPLELVIKHELIHYKNHDIFLKLLALLANILHFYNPMAYVIRREISLSRELVCDRQTLWGQSKVSVHAYGNAILSSLLTRRQTAFTTQFGSSKAQMKERLLHMMHLENKKKGIALVCAALIITVFMGTAIAFNMGKKALADDAGNPSAADSPGVAGDTVSIPENAASVESIPVLGDTDTITNIMLIGVDSDGQSSPAGRSDCMVLLTINESKQTIGLTPFPRDIYVSIPNNEKNKLNAAYALGGYDLLRQTVEQNFRLHVERYITVNYRIFKEIVDTMDGVDIELTNDEAAEIGAGTAAGFYHLNGEQALTYSRIRNIGDSEGNQDMFARNLRLCKMLQALMNETKAKSTVELFGLMNDVLKDVATNMSSNELTNYINKAGTILSYDINRNSVLNQSVFDNYNMGKTGAALVFKDAPATVLELQRQIYR